MQKQLEVSKSCRQAVVLAVACFQVKNSGAFIHCGVLSARELGDQLCQRRPLWMCRDWEARNGLERCEEHHCEYRAQGRCGQLRKWVKQRCRLGEKVSNRRAPVSGAVHHALRVSGQWRRMRATNVDHAAFLACKEGREDMRF
ncbi:hypothetical protein ERJ75_000260500 [Trypanosoma vivax]|nr:hypothetical protein ERJ75_000260700 [Trypanosoma vivax]KAH8618829.1 hypothetical protein ERJ75_000260500 [Trypanosoma vivax]